MSSKITATKSDYIEKLQLLFSSDQYFVRLIQGAREREDYWEPSLDPDGIRRDALTEFDFWRSNNYELVSLCARFISKTDKHANILDFGAGHGHLIKTLKENTVSARHYYAYDESNLARQSLTRVGAHVIEKYDDVFSRNYELIVLNHVVEHLENPVSVMKELISAINPGGYIIIGTPDFLSTSAMLFREKYRMLCEATHISLFSYDSLMRLMRDIGLKIEFVTFPFWFTPYFNEGTFQRVLMHDAQKTSPPFPGNFILAVGRKHFA